MGEGEWDVTPSYGQVQADIAAVAEVFSNLVESLRKARDRP